MKKLMILTAALVMISSATGCRCWNWLCRGAAYNPCPPMAPVATYADPCPPGVTTSPDTCAAPQMIPGPANYSPLAE